MSEWRQRVGEVQRITRRRSRRSNNNKEEEERKAEEARLTIASGRGGEERTLEEKGWDKEIK